MSKKVNFDYINQAMNKRYPSSKNDHQMICITNGKEVLRITRKKALEFFFDAVIITDEEKVKMYKELKFHIEKKENHWVVYIPKYHKWKYTTKSVYKQYIESLIPCSKIPAPKFYYVEEKEVNGEMKQVKIPKNYFI